MTPKNQESMSKYAFWNIKMPIVDKQIVLDSDILSLMLIKSVATHGFHRVSFRNFLLSKKAQ